MFENICPAVLSSLKSILIELEMDTCLKSELYKLDGPLLVRIVRVTRCPAVRSAMLDRH